uniref:Uncharacterized protein n=1 Tax=Oryza glaberrima TaxID=4538 RepID=I1QNU4_ORYGL
MPVQAMGRARPRRLPEDNNSDPSAILCARPCVNGVEMSARRRSAIFAQVVDGGVTSRRNGKMALFRNCRCLVGSLICL